MSTKSVCRLCYNEMHSCNELQNYIEVYSDVGRLYDCEKKINNFLYLNIAENDGYSKKLCLICLQHLETFYKFFEKVNEIQKKYLKEKYNSMVLKAVLIHHEIEPTDELEFAANPNEEIVDGQLSEEMNYQLVVVTGESDEMADEDVPNPIEIETIEINDDATTKSQDQDCVNSPRRSEKLISKITKNEATNDTRIAIETKPSQTSDDENVKIDEHQNSGRGTKRPRKLRSQTSKDRATKVVQSDDAEEEGESGNEFPARDSDNEDWPAQTILDQFPQTIIRNGLLTVKGKKLMAMISKFYKLECDLCATDRPRFKFLKQLFSHYQEVHKEEGHVMCCQTKLVRYPSIIMHMARHIQPDAFKCDICGYMVTRPRFLESHKQTHLPESEKPFGCNECPRRFCWKGALQIHQISHQPECERKLYICHVCGKIYDTPGGLSTHKKLIHSEKLKTEESHVCHVCAKSFATRTGLKEHMSLHQPREKDQVQCTECGKWLMNNRCLKSHMVLHSTILHSCTVCEYKTKKKVLLQRHLLTQHSNEKPFSCSQCGKKFKLKRALTVHLTQHTDKARTYKCQFCDREFAFSTNFYTHRKIKHPNELEEMKVREMEEKRKRRIAAGIEVEQGMSSNEMVDSQLDVDNNFGDYIESEEMDLELMKHESESIDAM